MAKATIPQNDPKVKQSSFITNTIDSLGNKGIWLLMAVLAVIIFVVYQDFLLSKKVFLYKDIGSDTLNMFYPYTYLQTEYIQKFGVPSWSFQYGMGQSIMLASLADIFNLIFLIGSYKKLFSKRAADF